VAQGQWSASSVIRLLTILSSYNIEAMGAFVDVETFFSAVYLVDFSPSLCDIARQRFSRLGWKNVTVVCQDARAFRLPESEDHPRIGGGADLISLSYSLSMIPDYYSVIDCLSSMLSPLGILGVCDFYGMPWLSGRPFE
jgi:betaine lipid synthase